MNPILHVALTADPDQLEGMALYQQLYDFWLDEWCSYRNMNLYTDEEHREHSRQLPGLQVMARLLDDAIQARLAYQPDVWDSLAQERVADQPVHRNDEQLTDAIPF